MTRRTSLALGEHFESYIEEKLRGGAYASASEVVRDGLRLLEERDSRLAALRDALIEGERSGTPQPLDRGAFFERARRSHS